VLIVQFVDSVTDGILPPPSSSFLPHHSSLYHQRWPYGSKSLTGRKSEQDLKVSKGLETYYIDLVGFFLFSFLYLLYWRLLTCLMGMTSTTETRGADAPLFGFFFYQWGLETCRDMSRTLCIKYFYIFTDDYLRIKCTYECHQGLSWVSDLIKMAFTASTAYVSNVTEIYLAGLVVLRDVNTGTYHPLIFLLSTL
jgi:hypothetical protein